MNQSRKAWCSSSVQILASLVEVESPTINWGSVAHKLNQQITGTQRNGKQCRERWNLEVSKKNEKNLDEINFHTFFAAFKEANEQRNKWKKISQILQSMGIMNWDQNTVKNYFYCSIRKALRKINKLIPKKVEAADLRNLKPSTLSVICSEPSSKQYLCVFENILNGNQNSISQEILQQIFDKLFEIENQYTKEKSQCRSPHKKNRKFSNTSFSTSFEEQSIGQCDYIQQQNSLNELIKPPKLQKLEEQMFFPDVFENNEGESVILDDIDAYLDL